MGARQPSPRSGHVLRPARPLAMTLHLGKDEPLEDGLPDKVTVVEDFAGVPTMGEVPIPDDFVADDEPDLGDLPLDPL
jgi:hypothetical protein